jgi:hypothetical protein
VCLFLPFTVVSISSGSHVSLNEKETIHGKTKVSKRDGDDVPRIANLGSSELTQAAMFLTCIQSYPVRISPGIWTKLSAISRGFPQIPRANSGIVPKIKLRTLPAIFFPIYYPLIILSFYDIYSMSYSRRRLISHVQYEVLGELVTTY